MTLANYRTPLLAITTLIIFSGCDGAEVDLGGTIVSAQPPVYSGPYVCDPFNGQAPSGKHFGLFGKLYSTTPELGQTYTHAWDFIENGDELPVDLFFTDVNVPTRPFDRGFVTDQGELLTNEDGNTLYEWFGLHMESRLRLTENDAPGKYQLALLSDDGAVLYLDPKGTGYESWVDNDGTHPTRLACANQTLTLNHHSEIPLVLQYYQGPRYHIAMIMLWREIPQSVDETLDPSVLSDPACDLMGNNKFFDSTKNPSKPTQNWVSLLDRGWRIVDRENFLMPDVNIENPCIPKGID